MALSTAAKRRNAAGVAFLPLGPGVTPDATPDAAWRRRSGWSYALEEAGGSLPPIVEILLDFDAPLDLILDFDAPLDVTLDFDYRVDITLEF